VSYGYLIASISVWFLFHRCSIDCHSNVLFVISYQKTNLPKTRNSMHKMRYECKMVFNHSKR